MANVPTTTAGGPRGSTMNGPLHLTGRTGTHSETPFLAGQTRIEFARDVLITSMSNSLLHRCNDAVLPTQEVMPKAGAICAISAILTTAITAGTLTVEVVKGAAVVKTITMTSATAPRTYTFETDNLTSLTYARGDLLSVRVDTTANFAPANDDLVVALWVA